jgi:hypothetical protein
MSSWWRGPANANNIIKVEPLFIIDKIKHNRQHKTHTIASLGKNKR